MRYLVALIIVGLVFVRIWFWRYRAVTMFSPKWIRTKLEAFQYLGNAYTVTDVVSVGFQADLTLEHQTAGQVCTFRLLRGHENWTEDMSPWKGKRVTLVYRENPGMLGLPYTNRPKELLSYWFVMQALDKLK